MGGYCHSFHERLGDSRQGHEKWRDNGSVLKVQLTGHTFKSDVVVGPGNMEN